MNEFRVIQQLKDELQRLHDGPPEQSYREIGVQLDMDHGNLQRFLSGEGASGMGLAKFAHICEMLRLELAPIRKPKGK